MTPYSNRPLLNPSTHPTYDTSTYFDFIVPLYPEWTPQDAFSVINLRPGKTQNLSINTELVIMWPITG